MGGSQKSHIPSAAPLSPRVCDSWLDKPQRRTLLNKCYDHLRWEKLFIKAENELLLVWFQGQLFLILSFCIFLQELQRSCIYNREGGKIQREDTYVFPIFSLSFVFVVFTMWDGLGEPVVREENKKACQAELTKLSPLNSWLFFFLVLYLPFAAFWNEVVLTSRSEPSSINFLGSVLMEEKS